VLLHWLSAVIILWATFSGFGVALLPEGNGVRAWVESLNPQVTTLFIPLFLWRLWLYLKARPEQAQTARQKIARLAHAALYLLVVGVLATGVLMMSHPVVLLAWLPLPQLVHSVDALAQLHTVHHILCAALGALVAVHILAVLQHQLAGHSVLYRMK
jgi:cytochrome b561